MDLTLSKPSAVVVRMANKAAVCRAEYTIDASTNLPGATTVTCSLPDKVEMAVVGTEELVPSIISNSEQATLTIDGASAATYISNRCNAIGCDQQATTTIQSGQVAQIESDNLITFPN